MLLGEIPSDTRPYEGGPRGVKKFVSYYQWIPIVIAIQAVLFHMPYVVWWTFNKRGGLHLPHFMYGKSYRIQAFIFRLISGGHLTTEGDFIYFLSNSSRFLLPRSTTRRNETASSFKSYFPSPKNSKNRYYLSLRNSWKFPAICTQPRLCCTYT